MTINDSFKAINDITFTSQIEEVFIKDAQNRVCAFDIKAQRNSPLFTNSAMDGYALNINDDIKNLKIAYSIFAGDFKEYELKKGECAKIMTGAKLPKNANAVVMKEYANINENIFNTDINVKQNDNIRFVGEEYKENELLISKNTLLNKAHIMLLASNGYHKIKCYKKINVAIFASGDELAESYFSGDYIYNSNSYALFNPYSNNHYLGILKDDYDYVFNALSGASKNYDLIITCAAASVGDADYVKKALSKLGYEDIFSKVLIKPAGPIALYKNKENNFVLTLPGNPMSCYVGAMLYLKKLLLKMQNCSYQAQSYKAKISCDIELKNNKENIIFGTYKDSVFYPFNNGKFSSAQITPLTNHTHFIRLNGSIKKDELIECYENNL